MTSPLPFSQACENNKDVILKVLQVELQGYTRVLEIGSGTGQHSVYFAPNLPHLIWQTSDVVSNHSYIKAWHDAYPTTNLRAPLAFDLTCDSIPLTDNVRDSYDAVFTANTFHIISWSLVQTLIELVGSALPMNGKLIVYGPFNEDGRYTSESNQRFDLSLKQRDAASGIRDKEDVLTLAKKHDLQLSTQYDMPANNQILVFQKRVQT
ncbi:DUF938 domain-containing protein [Psychrobacter sp. DM8]|uniref:DUF938 domain-containing protein n=1 Tax=Psychrobacter sp. DM8 TaxID=3440636 RepID=UPI003F50CA09